MSNINDSISGLEFAQIGWVVPDIRTAVKFLSNALGIAGFPQPEQIRAQDLDMTYYGKVVPRRMADQRSGPSHCTNGFLRHLSNAGRCHRDRGHHAGGMERD